MLNLRKISKSVGGRILFEDASLTINYSDFVALVGPNGAGKSTLFNIILSKDSADTGEVQRDEWTTVGFLPQEGEALGNETVLEIATGKAGALEEIESKLQELEASGQIECAEYYEAQAKFDTLSDPGLEAKSKKMLRGLGYKESDFDREAKEMSGGWVMRAHLARILAMEPDLLMLDEPTNHLDLEALLWFQNYLSNFAGAVLLISHDRSFMDDLVKVVYDIEDQKLISYKGNYSAFEVEKENRFEQRMLAWKNQQKEIEKSQEFIDRFRSVASKAAQAQSRQRQLDKMEKLEKPKPIRKLFKIQFPQPSRSGQRVVSLKGIEMSYGKNKIYNNLNVDIERGDRIALVGPNGAGKSTLIKIMAGEVEFQSGERDLGHNCRIGYFSQHRAATLDPEKSVLDECVEAAIDLTADECRGVLGSFLFRKEDVFKKTKVLSGGEKSRLNLVKFLLNPPNLLLMDEPTTHLDLISIDALIVALSNYGGSLVFISHDVNFIRKLGNNVWHIKDGNLTKYAGDYDYYLEKSGGIADARAAITS